jgi:hypothetical protein
MYFLSLIIYFKSDLKDRLRQAQGQQGQPQGD